MTAVTTPKGPTWKPAGSVVAAEANPAQPGQVIMAWSSGYLTSYGGAPLPPGTGLVIILESGESVVDMTVTNWSNPSGYLLTSRARVMSFGGATLTADRLKSIKDIKGGKAVAFAMDPAQTGGGYWINAHGEVFSFGQVPAITTTNAERAATRFMSAVCKGWAFDWATKRYLLLGSTGQVARSPLAAGAPVTTNATSKLSTSKFARSITYNWETGSGYILDGHGVIYTVGNAAALPADPHWPSWDVGRQILVASWGVVDTLRYYVVDAAGVVHARTRTTKPRVSVSAPSGTSAQWDLTTADGVGTIRLGYGTKTSRAIAHRSTVTQLEAALNDVLGAGNYNVVDNGATPELDVTITLASPSMDAALGIRSDSLGGASTTEAVAAAPAVLTTTARPVISWDYRDAESDAQGAWEVQVLLSVPGLGAAPPDSAMATSTPAFAASGSDDSTRSVKVSTFLTDDTSYRAYVRAQERNGLWSDWAYADFDLNLTVPTVPTATIAPDPGNAAVALTVTSVSGPSNLQNRQLLWWERRLANGQDWQLVRSSGTPLSNAFFFEPFDYDDTDELPAPWTTMVMSGGTAVGVRDNKARLLDPREVSKTFGRAVLAGSHPTFDGSSAEGLQDFLLTTADETESWDLPDVPFSLGGPFFSDSFSRVGDVLGSAPDDTEWREALGAWRTTGTAAYLRATNGTTRQVGLIDTGQERGTASVHTAPHDGSKTASLAIGVSITGAGHYLDITWTTVSSIDWYVRLRDGAGSETLIDSGSFAPGGAGADDKLLITAQLADDDNIYFNVQQSNDVEPFTTTQMHTDVASITPTGGTWWGFGQRSTALGAVGFADFFFATPDFAPGDADYVSGAWSIPGDGTIESLSPFAVALFDAQIDTRMSVVQQGAFDVYDRLWVRATDLNPALSEGCYLDADGVFIPGNPSDRLGYIPAFDSSGTGDVLTVQAYGRWLRCLLNGAPVQIDAGPLVSSGVADLGDATDWATTGATESAAPGALTLTPTGVSANVLTTAAKTLVEAGVTASVEFSVDAAGAGNFAQAYITSYLNDGTTEVATVLGPRVALDAVGNTAVRCVHHTGDTARKVRYGIVIEGTQVVVLNGFTNAMADEIQLPPSCRTGDLWGVRGGTWGQLSFDGVQVLSHEGSPGWGAAYSDDPPSSASGGTVADLRSVDPLTASDAVVMSWEVLDSDDIDLHVEAVTSAVAWAASRKRGDFSGLAAGDWTAVPADYATPSAVEVALQKAAGASFSQHVLASTGATHDDIVLVTGETIGTGEKLAIGFVAMTSDGLVHLSYEGEAGPVVDEVHAITAVSPYTDHPGSQVVVLVDVAVGEAADVTITMEGGSVALDWWGIVSTAADADSPMVAVLGRHEVMPDTGDAAITAALAAFGSRVVFVPLTADDINSNNLVGTVFEKVNAALTPPIVETLRALGLIESPYPSVTGTLRRYCALIAGGEVREVFEDSSFVMAFVDEGGVPGTLAIKIVVTAPDDDGTLVATIETGVALDGEVSYHLDFYDWVTDGSFEPGPWCGFQLTGLDGSADSIAIGGHDEPFRDYEALPGETYEYRIRISDAAGEVFSDPVSQSTVTVPQVGYWLKDPLDPTLNTRVLREEDDLETPRSQEQGVFDPPGRTRAIVVTGVTKAERVAPMTLSIRGEAELARVMALLNSGRTLLFQTPRFRQWYVRFGSDVVQRSIVDIEIEGQALFQVQVPEGVAVDVP